MGYIGKAQPELQRETMAQTRRGQGLVCSSVIECLGAEDKEARKSTMPTKIP